jgi:hypothetical protein
MARFPGIPREIADQMCMATFWQRTKNIFDVAVARGSDSQSCFLAIDRQGHVRIIGAAGWTVSGISHEFGATEVFLIQNAGMSLRVEGWRGPEHCVVTAPSGKTPGAPYAGRLTEGKVTSSEKNGYQPMTLQVLPHAASCWNARSPQV